jgi:hypothetical protein
MRALDMSRWEIELRYGRKLLDSDRRYLEIIAVAHPEVGYLRYRETGENFVVTVATETDTREEAIEQAMLQSRQLWIHALPDQADVAESS